MIENKKKIIDDFGIEWEKFNQINLDDRELDEIFNDYFDIFPWDKINKKSIGVDFGCGTGRWAKLIAPKCSKLTLLDGSLKSINVAKKMLKKFNNINYVVSDVTNVKIKTEKYDFAFSLGVLHHVPEINKALGEIYRILKPGAPFLIYLYYSFDNSPFWYKSLWKASDLIRGLISILPKYLKIILCEIIAAVIYLPLARLSWLLEILKINISVIPLSYYRNKSFYTMRTDSLDRFGTTYEKRFSRDEIKELLISNGFQSVKFSSTKPYWCAIAFKN